MASWVLQDKLPPSFKNKFQSYFPQIIIRSNIQNLEDCKKWISEFSILTNTQWNTIRNTPEGDRIAFSKGYVCHRSHFRKSLPASNKTRLSRNTDCKAAISIKGKVNTWYTRKKDPLIKEGLISVIKIRGKHNHSLETAEAGKFFSSEECEETFLEYFKDGLGVYNARKYHHTVLELDEKMTEADLSNKRVNPPSHVVNYWNSRFRKPPNVYHRTTEELIEKLKGKSDALEEKGTTIRFCQDPFALVIVTPLMKRAHGLKSSTEAVFIDSSLSDDPDSHCATFLFCACASGAIPLGVIITKGNTVEAFAKGFELLKTALDQPFCGKEGPSLFLVGEWEAKMKALALVWPQSQTYLCTFRVAQTIWEQLWYSKHNEIPKEHRVTLMGSFLDVLYAQSAVEAELAYSNACSLANSQVSGYHKWYKYIQDLWERKESWCLAFREQEYRKHNYNEFFEVTFKIYKDLILSRLKAHNVLTLLEFVSSHLERYYMSKMRAFAESGCPRMFLLSLKIKDPMLTHKDVAEEVDETSYIVKTKFEMFVVYTRSSCCSCRIRMQRRFCEHLYLVLEKFPVVSRNLPQLEPEDKEEILALAQEYTPPPIKTSISSPEPSDCNSSPENSECDSSPETSAFSPTPLTPKLEKPDSMVIKDVVSLASNALSSTPGFSEVPTMTQPTSSQSVGYYLVTVPRSFTSFPPLFEGEERKRLLARIKRKITDNDTKYGSSLSDLEAMFDNLKEVNSTASWQAFLRGRKGSSGLVNGSGALQNLPVQCASVPFVVPTGAIFRRVDATFIPSQGPLAKKSKTDS